MNEGFIQLPRSPGSQERHRYIYINNDKTFRYIDKVLGTQNYHSAMIKSSYADFAIEIWHHVVYGARFTIEL